MRLCLSYRSSQSSICQRKRGKYQGEKEGGEVKKGQSEAGSISISPFNPSCQSFNEPAENANNTFYSVLFGDMVMERFGLRFDH